MNTNDVELINKRIDDMREDIKSDLSDIKVTLKDIQISYQTQKVTCNSRITTLEHFKTKIITISAAISLIVGLIVGRGI